jgi:hypothetical protein
MDKLLTEWRKYLTEIKYEPCKTPPTGIGLKKGCRGENVEVLQTMLEFAYQTLWKEEFPERKVDKIMKKNTQAGAMAKRWAAQTQGFVKSDGFFGPQTEITVLGIQILFDLQETGEIDKKTFLTINKKAEQIRPGAFRVARASVAVKEKTIAGTLHRNLHAASPFGKKIPSGVLGVGQTKQ